jgi:hypothetical protein
MKFTASALISAITIVQLAVVGNASLVSSASQKQVMKRDDHEQPHLQKRILGAFPGVLLAGAALGGAGTALVTTGAGRGGLAKVFDFLNSLRSYAQNML